VAVDGKYIPSMIRSSPKLKREGLVKGESVQCYEVIAVEPQPSLVDQEWIVAVRITGGPGV
jgi:hypothetical protein